MKNILKIVLSISFVLLTSFLLSGCTTSEEKVSEYNRIVSEADILIEGKEYTLALEKLSSAVEILPSKVEAFKRIVDIFILKNRLEDVTKLIDDSGTELNGADRASLYNSVGDVYYIAKNFDKALYNYQLAKGMDGGSKGALLGMAKSYVQKGNIESAKPLLKENYNEDMQIEASLLLSYIEAITDTQKAKETIKDIEPGDTWRDKYVQWGEVLNSLNTDELYNGTKLGKEYIDMGYPYLAVALLEPNLEKMGEYIDGIYILGKAYYEYGEYQKSIDVLENSTSLSDLNQYIYWVLARDFYLLDDVNNSMSYYDSAISYGAQDAEESMYIEYLDILIEENLTEKALEVMKAAERIYDRDWVKMYYMNIYSIRDDSEKFLYYMNKIEYEKLDDEQKAQYLFSKGKYFILNSELDEAQRTLDIFWELNKYDPRYNLLVAQLNFQKGDLGESRIYAKKAMEYDLEGVVSQDAQKLLAQID